MLRFNKCKIINVDINNDEKNNNKVIKVYLKTTRTRANLEDIINKYILLVVENNLPPIILVIDTNIRSTTIDRYRLPYINIKNIIIFTTLKIKDYYNA